MSDTISITPIECLKDNYAYLISCNETREAVVVDPSEAAPVIAAVDEAKVHLKAIFNTHHHVDHVGGNVEVAARFGIDLIYGHASDKGRIPGQTRFLEDENLISFGRVNVRILHIPGHTLGAIAYVAGGAVFTGDTLFIAGCGRLFEGTAAQMNASFAKLASLEHATRVYCGHEYTESNLRFAYHVEPSNDRIAQARARASTIRANGKPTVPSTIGEELATNPFYRIRSIELRRTLGIAEDADDTTAFARVREAKNSFS